MWKVWEEKDKFVVNVKFFDPLSNQKKKTKRF